MEIYGSRDRHGNSHGSSDESIQVQFQARERHTLNVKGVNVLQGHLLIYAKSRF